MQVGSHPLGRAARALVVTGLLVALTTAAHTLGGARVSAAAVLVLTLLLLPTAGYAVGRRLGTGALLLLLGAGQGVGHVLLTAMTPSAHGSAERLPGHLAAHDTVDVALVGAPMVNHTALGHASTGHAMAGGTGGTAMLLTHILATVLLGVLLAKGETALWAVLAWLLPPGAAPARCGHPRLILAVPPRTGRGRLFITSAVARGPPVTL